MEDVEVPCPLPQEGEVGVEVQRAGVCGTHTIAKLGVGYVPEDRRILPTLTLRENLVMGSKPGQKGNGDGWTIDRVYNYFPALQARDSQKGGHLSGGEQQMLTIARTLMGNPEVSWLTSPQRG